MSDWATAGLWIAFRLGFSSILNKKEKGEVSNILDLKMKHHLETHNKLPTGDEIVMMFEKTYNDITFFYHDIRLGV